jgi:dephospho-CoA kinase
MIISVVGPISSGKGKVAEILREEGFTHHSFSSTIRAVAKERRIPITRKNLSELGKTLQKEAPDTSLLAERIVEMIEKDVARGRKKFVIEGSRRVDDIKVFKKHVADNPEMKFIIVAVDAPARIRFERLKARGRHGDPETFSEFKKIDEEELRGSSGQEVAKLIKIADYHIDNSGTVKEYEKNINAVLKKIGIR